MSLVKNNAFEFPGTQGKQIKVKTNLYPYLWNADKVGLSTVTVTRTKFDQKRTVEIVPPNKIFRLLKEKVEPNGCRFIAGFPNADSLSLYSIPPFRGGPRYETVRFPDQPENCTIIECKEFRGNNNLPIAILRFEFLFHGVINSIVHYKDNEPAQFLKKVIMQAIGETMNHSYSLIRNKVLASKPGFNSLPVAKVDFAKDVVTGIRMRFHPSLKNVTGRTERDKEASLVSINTCSLLVTRTNVSILQYFVSTVLRVQINSENYHPEDICGRSMTDTQADRLLDMVGDLEVYIDGERADSANKKYYTMLGITHEPASSIQVFDKKANRRVSLNDMYSRLTRKRIVLPGQRAAILALVSNKDTHVTVPLELIIISDRAQRVEGNSQKFRDAMINAALAPKERFAVIDSFVKEVKEGLRKLDNDSILKTIGMSINSNSVVVDGRVLDTPLMSDPMSIFAPFRNKLVDYVLFACHTPRENVESDVDATKENLDLLITRFKSMYAISFNECLFRRKSSRQDAVARLKGALVKIKEKRAPNTDNKLIFFVTMDGHDPDLYGKIKKILHDEGHLSQFITIKVLNDAARIKANYAFNLALKVNAKLGGIRIEADQANVYWKECMDPSSPTMLIGIDTRLSHKKNKLGRIGFVSSTDMTGSKYRAAVKVSDGFGRYTTDFSSMLSTAFAEFRGIPNHLLIYRAGMNEYDLSNLHGEAIMECNHIRDCLQRLFDANEIAALPTVTYIGYNRAHNVRFMRTDEPGPDDGNDTDSDIDELTQDEKETREKTRYNVPIGTAIDTQIVDNNSFYLVTHCAVAGTTKPAKYTIVRDEWPMTADNLLGLTYTLCNMSPRCRKSVRRPLPILLASLLLERMAEIYEGDHDREDSKKDIEIHENLRTIPFYT